MIDWLIAWWEVDWLLVGALVRVDWYMYMLCDATATVCWVGGFIDWLIE